MPNIIDSAWNLGPHAEKLVKGGVHSAIRYYNHTNSNTLPEKRLDPEEAEQLTEAGLSIAVVFQQNARSLSNFTPSKGKSDANRSLELAQKLKQPKGSGLYFAVDKDFIGVTALKKIASHFASIKAEVGSDFRVGAYGSGYILRHLLEEGLIDLTWLSQSTGWTGYKAFLKSHDWNLRQLMQKSWPGGAFAYDPNQANPAFPDFGQFSLSSSVMRPQVPQIPGSLMRVTARSGLNMRRGPGLEYDVVTSLATDSIVHAGTRHGDWIQIDLEGDENYDGFMHTGFLELVAGGPEPLRLTQETPYEISREELRRGVAEVPGSGNNPRIMLYHASTDSGAPDATPWCSSFVNWCVTQAGLTGTNSKWAMSWHDSNWGQKVSGTPQEGDIAVYKRHYKKHGKPAVGGHVGFVVKADNDTVQLLGGNQSNRVSIASYPRKSGTKGGTKYELLSFRRA